MKTPDSIAVARALPLERKVPNEETRRAMAEVDAKVPNAETRRAMAGPEEMIRRGTARFASAEEMFAELEKAGDQ